MADALTDFEIVSLIDADEFGQLYRGRSFTDEKTENRPSGNLIFRLEKQEYLIRQWTHPRLLDGNCRKRLELYWRLQKKSDYLAQIVAGDFAAGRWVYEPFVCSLANYSLFIESNSIYWRRAWHDACVGLSFLHENYLPHGRVRASEIYFSQDGRLKFGGVFPLFTDDSDRIPDKNAVLQSSQSASSFLKAEFNRDIQNLCQIFLRADIFENLPEEDQKDVQALNAKKMSLVKAAERVSIRFNEFQKIYLNQQEEREAQALIVKAQSAKRPRKGIGVLVSFAGLLLIIGVLTGGKIFIDSIIAPPTATTNPSQYTPGRKINQQEFKRSLDEQIKKDRIVSIEEQYKDKKPGPDLLSPPVLSDKPQTDVFVGKITSVRFQEIKVFNANLQKTITVFVDEKSRLSNADGTPIKLELLTAGKELEIQYEKNSDSESKVYGASIVIRDL